MSVPAVSVAVPDKRAQVEQLLGEIFRLAEWPARVELKDGADGGISVAVHFEGEVPGVTQGKKSYLVDSLQFLVNKVVNRPGVEKRWVTLGVGAFPEPKAAQAPAAQGHAQIQAQARASAPRPPRASTPPKASAPKPAPKASAPKTHPREESASEVEVTPEWEAVAKLLQGKAMKHGRPYAVLLLTQDERAQLVKAGTGAGLKVKSEGEGHFRRAAFVPDKLTPMPRKMQFPDDEDEDDEG